jgi:hypothetical protein
MPDSTYEKWIVPAALSGNKAEFSGGDGLSPASAYIITAPEQMVKLSQNVHNGTSYCGAYFRLESDIDMGGRQWQPIGYCTGPFDKREFSGTFDGGGHTISNFRISESEHKSGGLFGYIEYALIKNLYIRNFFMIGGSSMGGLAGYSESSTIIGCLSEGNINSESYHIGGIAGLSCNSTITNCISVVSISSKESKGVGGICGYAYNGSVIRSCESGGDLSASSSLDVGGFIGLAKDSSIENCYSLVRVKATRCSRAGGFAGALRNSDVSSCCAKGAIVSVNDAPDGCVCGFAGFTNSKIAYCLSSGSVSKSGLGGSSGGFVGYIVKGGIASSYSVGDVKGEGIVGGFVGSAKCSDATVTAIENCYCTGSVISFEESSSAGGFIGSMQRETGNVVVSRCYSYGRLSLMVSGFAPKGTKGGVVDCIWRRDEDALNQNNTDGRGVPALSSREFADQNKFIELGWSFFEADNVWCYNNEIYPARPHLNGLAVVQKQGDLR